MRTLFVLSFYTYFRVAQGCDGTGRGSNHRGSDNGRDENRDDKSPDTDGHTDTDVVTGGSFTDVLGKLSCESTYDDMIQSLNPLRKDLGAIKPTASGTDGLKLFTSDNDFKDFEVAGATLPNLQEYVTLSRILPDAQIALEAKIKTNCTAGVWYYVPPPPSSSSVHSSSSGNVVPVSNTSATTKEEEDLWRAKHQSTLREELQKITGFFADFDNPAETFAEASGISSGIDLITPLLWYCIRSTNGDLKNKQGISVSNTGGDIITFNDYSARTKLVVESSHSECVIPSEQASAPCQGIEVKCLHHRLQELLRDDKAVFEKLKTRFTTLYDGEMLRINNERVPYTVSGTEAVGIEMAPDYYWRNRLRGCFFGYIFPSSDPSSDEKICSCPDNYTDTVLGGFGLIPLQKVLVPKPPLKGPSFVSLFKCSRARSKHYLMNQYGRTCVLEAGYGPNSKIPGAKIEEE